MPKVNCPRCDRRGWLILRATHAGTRYELVVIHSIGHPRACIVGSGKAKVLLKK